MKQRFYVYILRSLNFNRFYTGLTSNFERRLKEHNSGATKSTKPYKPWKSFILEAYKTREEAREREKYLKSGIGRDWIKKSWESNNL